MPRKSQYSPFYCDLVIDHLKDGKSFNSFASHIGVSVTTLNNWRQKYADFSDACDIAAAGAQEYWERILHSAATGEIKTIEEGKYKNWHAGMVMFLMSSRFKDYKSRSEKQAEAMENMTPWDSITVTIDRKVD